MDASCELRRPVTVQLHGRHARGEMAEQPDVVFEGGNVATDGQDFDGRRGGPMPRSTFHRPLEKLFVSSNATSAAGAQVARIAAIVSADYPSLWPETIRGLVVHSAEWTPAMRAVVDNAGSRQAVGARSGATVSACHRSPRPAERRRRVDTHFAVNRCIHIKVARLGRCICIVCPGRERCYRSLVEPR